MQFVVFAAFAIILSVPEKGPPWAHITSPAWTWFIVFAQMVLPAAVTAVWSRLVCRRLEREPAWLPAAQRKLGQANMLLRLTVAAGMVASIYFTNWTVIVRRWAPIRDIWGLPDLIVLLPFLLSILAAWTLLYPADRAIRLVSLEMRLWAMVPARPVWSLRRFLGFNFRQHVLIIMLPMIPIVMANDFAYVYSRQLRQLTGVVWADQALLALVAGVVFLLAPLMLRYVWHTRLLPVGELRERLEIFCRRIGLGYRRILIWESDGMVVNAAVMGMVRPVRYILLSDGLIEMLEDRQIEAVFGHEAGHVKLWHIQYYLLFALCSMFAVGGVLLLVQLAAQQWPALFPRPAVLFDYLQVVAMLLIVLLWGFGFGLVSRRFEWQADLFGARSVTPPADRCSQPCLLHGTADVPHSIEPAAQARDGLESAAPPGDALESTAHASVHRGLPLLTKGEPGGGDPPAGSAHNSLTVFPVSGEAARHSPLCATAAAIFADSLERIAVLNGIPAEARSWRHSSIANRMQLLDDYARDARLSARLERSVLIIKGVLVLGTLIGCIASVWIYWPS